MAVEPFEAVSAFVAQVEKKYAYVTDTAYTDGGLVGADRAGREQALHRLERVFLPDAGVTGAGEHGAIAAACGAIEELDLQTCVVRLRPARCHDVGPPLVCVECECE